MSQKPDPKPTFPPTRWGTLLLVTLGAGVLSRWAMDLWYGQLPPLSIGPAVTIAVIACLEAIAAARIRQRILRTRPDVVPIEPLLVARFAALAKASAMLGSVVLGLFVGALVWLLPQRDEVSAIADDAPAAIAGAVAGALLTFAALWLEHSCRIPPSGSPQERSDGVSGADVV